MIAVTSTYETVLKSGKYTDAEKVLLMKWLLDRSVKLPERLGRVAEVLGEDQDRIARGEDERKRKNRERMRRVRAMHNANNAHNAHEAHNAHPPSPSSPPHPPINPSPQDAAEAPRMYARVRASANRPTLDAVLAFAADGTHHPQGKVYPEEWAKDWYSFLSASDPPFTDKNGQPIMHWQQKMINDWRIKGGDERKTATCDGIRRGTFANQQSNKRGLD